MPGKIKTYDLGKLYKFGFVLNYLMFLGVYFCCIFLLYIW